MSQDIATPVSTGHTDAYIAYNALGKTVMLGLGGFAFGAVGIWMMLGGMGQSWLIFAMGLLAFVFFVPMGIGWLWLAADRRRQLVIDAQGFYWRRWSQAIIAWEDIAYIEPFAIGDNPMLGIGLFDEEKYRPRGLMRFISGVNKRTGFDGLTVTLTGLDVNMGELMQAVHRLAPQPAPEDLN